MIAKADSSGNFIWAKAVPDYWVYMATDTYGNLYVAGISGLFSKYNRLGSLLWSRTSISSGGANGIGCDKAGNVYLTGRFSSTTAAIGASTLVNTDPSGSTYDCFVAKYDSSGTALWAKKIGGNLADRVGGFCVTQSGNIYIGGMSISDTVKFGGLNLPGDPPDYYGNNKITFLAKYDMNGNAIWVKKMDRHATVSSITSDVVENLYLTGSFDSTMLVGTQVLTTISGSTMIVKCNSAGNYLWAKSSGIHGSGKGYQVSVDRCGKLWTCGNASSDSVKFDGNTSLVTDTGQIDPLFIVEYDTSGNYLNCLMLPSGGDDVCGLVVDNRGDFFISGDYLTNGLKMYLGHDTISDVAPLTQENFFVAKYKYDLSLCAEEVSVPPIITTLPGINLYPNPAMNICSINSDLEFKQGATADVYDITGRRVNTYVLSGNNVEISVSTFPSGIYQFRINIGNNIIINRKLVIIR